ncbi:MAG: lycopene cyclase domain-containing protein [Candidatus Micrarchaeia archaeon]
MPSTYLLVLLASAAVPALLTAIRFVDVDLRRAFSAIILVAIPFVIWDVLATERGDWGFSGEHLIGIYLLGLPVEEVLFFIIVPFCCIFLYECTALLIKEKPVAFRPWMMAVPTAVALAIMLANIGRAYTVLACLAFTASCIALALAAPHAMFSRRFWLYMGLSFAGFLIVNTALTAPPIVHYNSSAITGLRIGTIPAEDFLYNFALLTFLAFAYIRSSRQHADSQ